MLQLSLSRCSSFLFQDALAFSLQLLQLFPSRCFSFSPQGAPAFSYMMFQFATSGSSSFLFTKSLQLCSHRMLQLSLSAC
jgi:hypothetical protein